MLRVKVVSMPASFVCDDPEVRMPVDRCLRAASEMAAIIEAVGDSDFSMSTESFHKGLVRLGILSQRFLNAAEDLDQGSDEALDRYAARVAKIGQVDTSDLNSASTSD